MKEPLFRVWPKESTPAEAGWYAVIKVSYDPETNKHHLFASDEGGCLYTFHEEDVLLDPPFLHKVRKSKSWFR